VHSTMTDDAREFQTPGTMTPHELGDSLALLVWESLSDFLVQDEFETPLPGVDTLYDDDGTADHTAEEALIFFLWAHTRGTQLAFVGRAPDERIRRGLDALHSAVFDDMVENGTPRSQLPLFEQRVSARYAEYHHASAHSDGKLGEVVGRHLLGDIAQPSTFDVIRERAVAVANPLRDFLEEVDLIEN
jgi:hypothetical protein